MLLEQDPFMLEENRYLRRLQKSETKQNLTAKNHELKYIIPGKQQVVMANEMQEQMT